MTKTHFFNFYFPNVHISVGLNNDFENLKICIHVANIYVEGKVSQIFAISPSLYFISEKKQGTFWLFF